MGALWSMLQNALFSKKLEMVLVGLENGGKSTILSVLADGRPIETTPTIGLAMRQFNYNGSSVKCWDLGGQEKFRTEWPRYTRGVDCILFVVDTSEREKLPTSRKELHQLLEHLELNGIPVLIIANKIDKEGRMSRDEVIQGLNLDYVTENAWDVVEVSALRGVNMQGILSWLMKQKKRS
eukprot:c700_g1_i1.p1 GENE.c700_g1_i1~~c700_g1_i1.p1  ORF type:complete len:180 (-),score=38.34 c700_g1_i1:41-580(-)